MTAPADVAAEGEREQGAAAALGQLLKWAAVRQVRHAAVEAAFVLAACKSRVDARATALLARLR